MSSVLKSNLQDELLVAWDFFLTRTVPFLALPALPFPSWFVVAVRFSYEYLAPVLIAFALYLFYARRGVFREFIGAFSLSFLLMVPLWALFPAITPQNRFIDNVYGLPSPPVVTEALSSASLERIDPFLERMRAVGAGSVPAVSTIPSAHVVWAALLGYYAFRARRALGFLLLPFVLLSGFGTVYLAQHYFVDVLAGLLLAAVTIWIISFACRERLCALRGVLGS